MFRCCRLERGKRAQPRTVNFISRPAVPPVSSSARHGGSEKVASSEKKPELIPDKEPFPDPQKGSFKAFTMEDGVKEDPAKPKEVKTPGKAGWLKKSSGKFLASYKDRYVQLDRTEIVVYDNELEHPHTVPADGAVGVEVEGHQAFWTCDYKPFILVLTTVPPHTDSLVVSTKTKAGLVTEDDPPPF
ncbi:hypothetical protein NFI96_005831 [Prochilodus magdalenae]|nr:hypothetical protein NFI96_005831 [Prochilodus magdalenae]